MNADKAMILEFLRGTARMPTPFTANSLAVALGLCLVDASARPGRVVLRARPASTFVQGAGVLQGGALVAMADFAMAFAVMAAVADELVPSTTTVHAEFLRPAPHGEYEVIGEVEKVGRSIAFARARVASRNGGATVLTAGASLLVVPDKP